MIDTIVNLLSYVWELIRPIKLLHDYEIGVVYYKGAYLHDMKQGWNYKNFWELKEFKVIVKQDDTQKFGSQRLNGWTIVPRACFRVRNARKYFKNVLSAKDSMVEDIIASCVSVAVHANPDKNPLDLLPVILSSARHEIKRYGYEIRMLEFTTCDRIRGYHHIIDKESDGAHE